MSNNCVTGIRRTEKMQNIPRRNSKQKLEIAN